MLFEFFNHLISLDLAWLASLIASNLHWLFAVTVLIFFFFNGKKVILGVIVFFLLGWAWGDFETLGGIALFVGGFLGIYYITKVVVLIFAENTPELQSKLIWISEFQSIGAIIIYNVFLR
jgi:hypothetical protein